MLHKLPQPPYSKKTFIAYEQRLTEELLNRGISSDDINENESYKEYISNFANDQIINKESQLASQGRVARFVSLEASVNHKTMHYPIIHVYNGHFIESSIFFTRDNDGIKYEQVDVDPSPLFIP